MAIPAGVIAAGIGAVGAAGSAGISAISSNASSHKQYRYQSALQKQAAKLNYQYSEKSALNSPTWNRSGLESAGYNPMLAVQNSTSGANSNFTSAGQSTAPDYAGAISQGVANAQSFQRLKNETNTADSQVKANEATAENQSSQAMNNLEENKWISPKRKAEIANIEGDTMLKDAQIKNMEKQIELGFAGVNVQQQANAISEENNKRTNRVLTTLEHIRHPYLSFLHNVYTSGKGSSGKSQDGRTAREIVGW